MNDQCLRIWLSTLSNTTVISVLVLPFTRDHSEAVLLRSTASKPSVQKSAVKTIFTGQNGVLETMYELYTVFNILVEVWYDEHTINRSMEEQGVVFLY